MTVYNREKLAALTASFVVKQDIGLSEKKDVGKQAEVTGAGQPVIMTAEEASTPVRSVKADHHQGSV